ncbi:unnamed protein product [marine sediment metagenome]|uniref:Uncharacterized protein n=1 Tax=marine sediment metagenome TaxID=412755 RepID=X1IFX9_9ZZZZ
MESLNYISRTVAARKVLENANGTFCGHWTIAIEQGLNFDRRVQGVSKLAKQ